MKKIILVSCALAFCAFSVLAIEPRGNQAVNPLEEGQVDQGENAQTDEQWVISQQDVFSKEQVKEVRQRILEKEEEMNQEVRLMGAEEQKVYRNQNQVRLAVHSLLEMKDAIGGIGEQVSQIARDFNNSVNSTIAAEEKIQVRSRILRFFAGGDEESAAQIEQEVNRNIERIEQLKMLKGQCDCGEELENMLQEQIQNMEQEQNRLNQLAQQEKEYKWVFGRMFSWFKNLLAS